MTEVAFVEIEHEGWPEMLVADTGQRHGWRSFIHLEDGSTYSSLSHDSPEEAVASLERILVQELAVPGPGYTDRRRDSGRRLYDLEPEWSDSHVTLLDRRRT